MGVSVFKFAEHRPLLVKSGFSVDFFVRWHIITYRRLKFSPEG